jgi:predicted nucleic acid-binding Zn ribbon protein
MPLYEFECLNEKCMKGKKPFEFEAMQSLNKCHEPVECPKCNNNKDVKKVIRTAVPKSQSWRAS